MSNFDKNLLIKKRWLIILTIIVLCLPWIFTQDKLSVLDFTKTGQIGDTIGGILSPFIAILVGYLTFEAFRMQYVANEMQHTVNKSQYLKDERERFDNRFYSMLETQRTNSESVRCGMDMIGKDAFKPLLAELLVSCYVVKKAYLKYKSNLSEEKIATMSAFEGVEEEKLLTRMAYGLFFYGELYDVDKDVEPVYAEVLTAVKNNVGKNGTVENSHDYQYYLNHEIQQGQLPKFKWDMFEGHNEQLGHYFRHLYQMVKFVALADSDVISEDDKNEYARIIRSELSDFEQALLFYNVVSDRGAAWNKSVHEEGENEFSKLGLLSRFRLIKNIPGNILYRGIDPWTFYLEDEKWWKERDKYFFEQCYILTAEDDYTIDE